MKKNVLSFFSLVLMFSCNTTDKGNEANNRGPNDGRAPHIAKVRDTIDVFSIIQSGKPYEPIPDGAPREEVTSVTIVQYDDTNKDTILATIKLKGIIHPPPLGSNPPDEPFERSEKYKFYKVNGDWKADR
jgi:hypothetical protein